MRRLLSIYPLYYLIILISFLLIPFLATTFPDYFSQTPHYFKRILGLYDDFFNSLILYVVFLPNIALYFGKTVVGASQSWSIGVEEQFYLIWPFLIYFFPKKKLVLVFTVILVLMGLISLFVTTLFPFEFMAIGALAAYLHFYYQLYVKRIISSSLRYAVYITLLMLLFFPLYQLLRPFQNIGLGFIYAFLILIIANSNHASTWYKQKLAALGKISYGIYMFHPFVMFLVFPFAQIYCKGNLVLYNATVYFFVFSLTIVLSYISYNVLEKRFIKIKDSIYKVV